MSSIKIISGSLGGRTIKTTQNRNLKPRPARVREQIFSWLRPIKKDSVCLDLFAGSGSLGIEAFSNGAKKVVFIEQNQELYNILYRNCQNLKILSEVKLHKQSAENYIRRTKEAIFDLIFLDPPFKDRKIKSLIDQIKKLKVADENSLLVIHRNKKSEDNISHYLNVIDEKKYGLSKIFFCKLI